MQRLRCDWPFLDLMEDIDRSRLIALGRIVRLPAGAILIHQGEPGERVVILLCGHAKVTRGMGTGREALLQILDPGDIAGELSHLDELPRAATVTAIESVEALILGSTAFAAYLERCAGAKHALLQVLVARVREGAERSAEMGGRDAMARVAARLIELCDRYGSAHPRGIEVRLSLTLEELTAWAGASRASVAKSLQTFRELRWVETHRRRMVVLDPEALRNRAG